MNFPTHSLSLLYSLVPGQFSVCRLPPDAPIPQWALRSPFVSVTRTADELSVVCPAANVPDGVQAVGPSVCFKLKGPFPLTQTGVLASFIEPLAAAGIAVFCVATFDTDYVLIAEEFAGAAMEALRSAGHELE